jgi:hypothetical protein
MSPNEGFQRNLVLAANEALQQLAIGLLFPFAQ